MPQALEDAATNRVRRLLEGLTISHAEWLANRRVGRPNMSRRNRRYVEISDSGDEAPVAPNRARQPPSSPPYVPPSSSPYAPPSPLGLRHGQRAHLTNNNRRAGASIDDPEVLSESDLSDESFLEMPLRRAVRRQRAMSPAHDPALRPTQTQTQSRHRHSTTMPTQSLPGSSVDSRSKRRRLSPEDEQEQQPWYHDERFETDMYRGDGYSKFPVALGTIPGHADICKEFTSRKGKKQRQDDIGTVEAQAATGRRILAKVQQIIPDISCEFVEERIKSYDTTGSPPEDEIVQGILNSIFEMDDYPRKSKQKNVKSQAASDGSGVTIPVNKDARKGFGYTKQAVILLAGQFPFIPTVHVQCVLNQKSTIFDAYIRLYELDQSYYVTPAAQRAYRRCRQPRTEVEKKYQQPSYYHHNASLYGHWVNEVQAAKQNLEREAIKLNKKETEARREAENLEQHRKDNALIECHICFDSEIPLNRSVSCTAEEGHLFCYACVQQLADTQVGLMKHKMNCQHGDGCNARLDREGIGRAVPLTTVDRLAFNEQQADIMAAGIDGLEECPHCDYKAIMDPVEMIPVFNCLNPECGRMSCRACKEDAHTPLTCEEFINDRGLNARHQIEEARTASVVRSCPRCNVKIIKELGCNKMACSKCGCLMCYLCKADISKIGYEHFNKSGSKCELYDKNTAALHEAEADAAELEAIKKAKAGDSTLDETKLRIETGKVKKPAPPPVPPPFVALPYVPPPFGEADVAALGPLPWPPGMEPDMAGFHANNDRARQDAMAAQQQFHQAREQIRQEAQHVHEMHQQMRALPANIGVYQRNYQDQAMAMENAGQQRYGDRRPPPAAQENNHGNRDANRRAQRIQREVDDQMRRLDEARMQAYRGHPHMPAQPPPPPQQLRQAAPHPAPILPLDQQPARGPAGYAAFVPHPFGWLNRVFHGNP